MDGYINVSGSGFEYLQNFTSEIYGERGQFMHSLKRYLAGPEWHNACRVIKTVEEIPVITEEQIRQQIQWEAMLRAKAYAMQNFVWSRSGEVSEEYYCAIAADMGLAPSPCPWEETLFPHIVDLFVCSKAQEEEIFDCVERHKSLLGIIGNCMMDSLSDRQVISCRGRMLLSQGYVRNFYRGENAYYGTSRPSLFRSSPIDPEEAKFHRLIGHIRTIEFSLWIQKLDYVKQWPCGDVFHGAIAQHYGIPTNGLDVTSDLKVALFFACCYFDQETKRWHPLEKEQFEYANARADVAKLGGDSRYGLIFSAPADISAMSEVLRDQNLHFSFATPIGYQPFMRCAHQSGYIIEAGEPYDLYKDATYAKHKFRLTEELCQWIYHEMQEGEAIYPNEGLLHYQYIIDDIMRLAQYSEEALRAALRCYAPDLPFDTAVIELAKRGHICKPEVQWCSDEIFAEINSKWTPPEELMGGFPPKAKFTFDV